MKMGMCWSSSSPISNVKTQSSASVTYGVSTEMSKVAFSGNSDSSGNSGSSASTFNEDSYPNGMILPHPNLKVFSFTELKVATENFRSDMVLGEGGFGKVYKGFLDDKSNSKSGVAIKKLKSESAQGFQEWQSEIKFLGRLSHPNLVKLLGYCWEDTEAESILHGTSTPTKDKAVISGTPEKQEGKRSTETPETKTDDTAAKKVRLDFTQTT